MISMPFTENDSEENEETKVPEPMFGTFYGEQTSNFPVLAPKEMTER